MNTPWTQARQIARDTAKPLEAVELDLREALGTALAAPLRALTSQPTCDTSAMDGFAVSGPGPWAVVGRVRAGDPPPRPISPGQAVEIATGAVVPPGADTVVPVERWPVAGATGQHIRRAGEDWTAGRELLPAGTVVSPAVLGLAAGAGHDALLVHRRPRVAVLVTGDELLRSGTPRPGRVRDSIGPLLPGVLAAVGAQLCGATHLRDSFSVFTEAIVAEDADVLVVCGATSVGKADHLRRALAGLHADVRVSGVACRPGHPQLLAVLPDGRCLVGLPGNPFAALAACVTLLQPLLGAMAGRTNSQPTMTRLRDEVTAHPRDTRLVPVTRGGEQVGHDRPGALWGAALADALAVVPPGHQGGEVELLPLT